MLESAESASGVTQNLKGMGLAGLAKKGWSVTSSNRSRPAALWSGGRKFEAFRAPVSEKKGNETPLGPTE